MRGFQAIRYIFFETLPAFLMGVLVFVGILLMFQALRLTEFVLVHGVGAGTVGQIMLYLSVSFLPVILPMSLLFAVLLTYSRLSNDSEIVALKALGLSMGYLTVPALLLSMAATIMSAQTSFYLGPWGNRKFEVLINELGRQKAAAAIKEGVFSEGFFDLVVYANKVESDSGRLNDVFIYDERDANAPITIIAKEGQILQESSAAGQSALLRLTAGNIHRTQQQTYTKVDFSTYDINLFNPYDTSEKKKSGPSMNLDELRTELARNDLQDKDRRKLQIEYHRRWSLSAACMIFALLGVGLGTVTNRRSSRGGGFVICLVLLISYWICYVGAESAARSGWLPPYAALWLVNAIFLAFAAKSLKNSWA
ncbi:MAG TPA: LPS export ABC transporter permease LptF [Bdellovibrionales bacterium]|nr:LPS export ABC transporter permease LptF [Bdellovibrionales bacterium]